MDGQRTADGREEVMIMLFQLSDVVVVEAGAELGKNIIGCPRHVRERYACLYSAV